MTDMHRISCQIEAESEKGVRISHDGQRVWLPKSQIEIVQGGVNAPLWLIEAKGLSICAQIDEWREIGEEPPVDLGDPSDWGIE